jgi:hypothetical protein
MCITGREEKVTEKYSLKVLHHHVAFAPGSHAPVTKSQTDELRSQDLCLCTLVS